MTTTQYTANASIPIGSAYDTANNILGNILSDGKIEVIPKLTAEQFSVISKQSQSLKTGYKIFNVTQKRLFMWDGGGWGVINDAIAGALAANTSAGQTVVYVANTTAPNAGQVLTATSATEAVWADATGGGGPLPTNASYTTLIGNGIDSTITITHNLNTEAIIYGVWEATGLKRSVDSSVSLLSTNAIQLHFNTVPATGEYRVTIISSVFSNAIVIPPSLPDQIGNNGKFLATDGSNASWQFTPSPVPSPSGHSGQFLGNDGTIFFWSDVPTELPAQSGNSGRYLATNGSAPSWQVIPTWMANPMSSSGDIIIGGTAGAAGRLGAGTEGQVLTVSGTTLTWTTQVPAMTGQSGKFLTNNGVLPSWTSFNEVPTITGPDSGKLLSNNGSIPTWITNTNPPDVTSQGGKFLTNNGSLVSWGTILQVPTPVGQYGKILTNDNASSFWGTLDSLMPSQTGKTGQFLTTNGSVISWNDPPSGFANPMTSVGDIIIGGVSGAAGRTGIGTSGQVLTVVGGVPTWSTITAMINPMTTIGDLIVGSTSGVAARLSNPGAGYFLGSNNSAPASWVQGNLIPTVSGHTDQWLYSNGTTASWQSLTQIPTQTTHSGQYLTTDGSNVSWATIPSGFSNPMNSIGDLIIGTTAGAATKLSVGTAGQILAVVAGAPGWINNVIGLPAQSGNNGKYLTTNATTASWSQIYQVPSVVGFAGKFLGTPDGITYSWMDVPGVIPSITGQGGKYLSTDGSTYFWTPYSGLPSLTGQTGKILTTDGVTSFWIDPAGAGAGILSRLPIVVTSSSLALLTDEILTVNTTCKTFQIQKLTASSPCRLRIYATSTAATLDRARLASVNPTGDHKMYFEAIFTAAVPSIVCTPIPTCSNQDITITTDIYMTIQNTGSTTAPIVLTFELMKFE